MRRSPGANEKPAESTVRSIPADLERSWRETGISLDIEKYRPFLDDCDLSEEQKEEFLQTLWMFVVHVVGQAFDQGDGQPCDGDPVDSPTDDTRRLRGHDR